tara:strand:+ start:28 stop:666 length:639 start_codon:yes stop_codon:yes gene_type:complete
MILFLDTVSSSPEFSIISKNKVIYSIQILNKNSNKISNNIIPIFLKIQQKFNIRQKIKKLIICNGPGSYTALRVGIAFMYGLSISTNIPLSAISCVNLMQIVIEKKNINKTLLFICSSNDQNFICSYKKHSKNYIIKKINNDFAKYKNNYLKYNYSVSNQKLPSYINKNYLLKNHKEIKFKNIIKSNMKLVLSLPEGKIIDPIYISDNKILN